MIRLLKRYVKLEKTIQRNLTTIWLPSVQT